MQLIIRVFEATKWLLEEKLKWSKDDIKTKIIQKVFIEHGLSGMLAICFDNSYKKAIKATYPELEIEV